MKNTLRTNYLKRSNLIFKRSLLKLRTEYTSMFISGFDKQTEGYTSGRPLSIISLDIYIGQNKK